MKLLYVGPCLLLLLVMNGCSSSKEDRTLVYRNDFGSVSSLDDWVMEGPGVAEIDDGRLLIHSKWQPNLEELQGQIDLRESGGDQYYAFLEEWVKESEPGMLEKYMLTKDGKSRFIGGHVQYWNKVPHPENFLIRIRFQPACPYPLHMVSFCGRGLDGENVLDPSLAPRFGLGGQYMNGDIQNYRISYWTGTRGTINMRRAPGRVLVDGVEGHLPMSALDKEVLLEIYRFEGKIVFKCDGVTMVEWTDPEPLSAGSFSLRLMAAAKGWYDEYEVYELHSNPFAG